MSKAWRRPLDGEEEYLAALEEDDARAIRVWAAYSQLPEVQSQLGYHEQLHDLLRNAREEAGVGFDSESDPELDVDEEREQPEYMEAARMGRQGGGSGDGGGVVRPPEWVRHGSGGQNWWARAQEWGEAKCDEMRSFMRTLKDRVGAAWREVPEVLPDTLRDRQALAYSIVRRHFMAATAAAAAAVQDPLGDVAAAAARLPQLLMGIYGTAGTGKSHLIYAIKRLLGDACLLSATTGKAAFLICGETLHSTSQLPVKGGSDLKGASLQRLQNRFRNVRYLVVDEISMLSQVSIASSEFLSHCRDIFKCCIRILLSNWVL